MDNSETVAVELTWSDLTILIGGGWEAVFELGDAEFAIRVGRTAAEARALLDRLSEIRRSLERPST